MTTDAKRIIDAVLAALSLDDRLAALVTTIMARRLHVIEASVSMISTAAVMSRHLSETDRVRLAEIVRDVADEIESNCFAN